MFYQSGYFKPLVARKTARMMLRQLVPPLFVMSVVVTAAVGIWVSAARGALAAIVGADAALVLTGAARTVRKPGVRCAGAVAAVVATMHVCFGVGYLRGVVE